MHLKFLLVFELDFILETGLAKANFDYDYSSDVMRIFQHMATLTAEFYVREVHGTNNLT